MNLKNISVTAESVLDIFNKEIQSYIRSMDDKGEDQESLDVAVNAIRYVKFQFIEQINNQLREEIELLKKDDAA